MGGACSAYGGEQRHIQGCGGEWGNLKERVPSGFPTKTHLGRPKRRWEDNVKKDLGSGMLGCGLDQAASR